MSDEVPVRAVELERRQDRDHGVLISTPRSRSLRSEAPNGAGPTTSSGSAAPSTLSRDHRDFIAAGGLNILIQDGSATGASNPEPLCIRAQQAAHADRRLSADRNPPTMPTADRPPSCRAAAGGLITGHRTSSGCQRAVIEHSPARRFRRNVIGPGVIKRA